MSCSLEPRVQRYVRGIQMRQVDYYAQCRPHRAACSALSLIVRCITDRPHDRGRGTGRRALLPKRDRGLDDCRHAPIVRLWAMIKAEIVSGEHHPSESGSIYVDTAAGGRPLRVEETHEGPAYNEQ